MLRIHDDVVQLQRDCAAAHRQILKHDADLARQLRRASTSVLLNLNEGSCSQGRNRRARYFNALGSANETRACLDAAVAWGLIEPLDDVTADRLDKVGRTLNRLAYGA